METKILSRIKLLRETKGYKQNEMAQKLNIEPSTYNKLESGENHTWAKYLPQIIEALEISFQDFFKDLDEKNFIQNNTGENINNPISTNTNNIYNESKEHCISLKEEIEFLKRQILEKDKLIEKSLN
jgi:transcriptional regulator with XRE-family HTH domain